MMDNSRTTQTVLQFIVDINDKIIQVEANCELIRCTKDRHAPIFNVIFNVVYPKYDLHSLLRFPIKTIQKTDLHYGKNDPMNIEFLSSTFKKEVIDILKKEENHV